MQKSTLPPDPKAPDDRSGIQVIARGAQILRALAAAPHGLSLAGIAQSVGLARSTVQRIVQALEAEGFVESAGPRGGFRLGPALGQLAYRRQADIAALARPFLEDLCTALGETVALCAVSGGQLTTLDRCIPERTLRVVFPLGTIPGPAWQLAPGLAILAETPERADPALGQVLARVRAEGHAIDEGCTLDEIRGCAVALATPHGVAAIAAVLPAARFDARRAEIVPALKECRDRILASLDR